MKNNKGISIITLVTTIAVILILASITIYYGLRQNVDKAGDVHVANEVYSLVDAIANRALLHRLNPSYYHLVGTPKNIDEISNEELREKYVDTEGWYLISSVDDFNELGLDNVTGSYWINYETGDVLVEEGIEYKETTYYSLNDLKNIIGGSSAVIASAEYDAEKKMNKPILSTGMVPVKYVNNNWVVTTTDDTEWYDYSKSAQAWANVMLKDELTVRDDTKVYTNDEVRSMTLSKLKGKIVETEGSAYVWIPRYTTSSLSSNADIIFSNLTNDITSLDGVTYVLPNSFKYAGIELTGIWISKYEASYDR